MGLTEKMVLHSAPVASSCSEASSSPGGSTCHLCSCPKRQIFAIKRQEKREKRDICMLENKNRYFIQIAMKNIYIDAALGMVMSAD